MAETYNKARGLNYYRFLKSLHRQVLFDWYLEVGCRAGLSFAPVRGKTIAVDPYFRAELNIIGQKPALHVFQATSDDFFAGGFLRRNGIKLGAAFLDGMHLFEYLLRDFINTEANADPNGVIMLHDCVPFSFEMTTRDLENLPNGPWTGDVWKLIPILQAYRPDLKLTVLDCRPTGVVCISNLNPKSQVLRKRYEKIVAEYLETDIEAFGVERFFSSFAFTSALEMKAEGFALFRPVELDAGQALQPRRVTP
ncbi:MAG: class I SAM-dependent methyltransferase [Tabrizicola sp.]|nr:class I SAM-dependent methyltransferase [Tabrizicola sp.]